MADKKTESTMKEFMTNDQEDYYSGITCITVNGKNAYELKGKFLDDLHNNAFSGTNGEDAVEHIEYFLKIVDPIDLPNVNYDKLRVVVFPISLAGDAWRWFDGVKGSFTRALWDYWKMGNDKIEPMDDESSDLEETDHDDEQEIAEIFGIELNLKIGEITNHHSFSCRNTSVLLLHLFVEGRDEKKRLDHLKQDQEMLVIKIFSERKKVFRGEKKCEKIRAKRSDFQQGIEQLLYMQEIQQEGLDVGFDGAYRGVGDEEVVVGEGVVVTSSSLEMLTNSCLGGIMVSLIFLEGLEEEALVEFMVEMCEEDEDSRKNEKDGLFNLKANDQSRKA
ncbi:hypothetical protein Tco_1106240 [Tanacetum coccineum]